MRGRNLIGSGEREVSGIGVRRGDAALDGRPMPTPLGRSGRQTTDEPNDRRGRPGRLFGFPRRPPERPAPARTPARTPAGTAAGTATRTRDPDTRGRTPGTDTPTRTPDGERQ